MVWNARGGQARTATIAAAAWLLITSGCTSDPGDPTSLEPTPSTAASSSVAAPTSSSTTATTGTPTATDESSTATSDPSADTTPPTSTTTSVVPVSADAQIGVTVSNLVADMTENHEGRMHGVPDNYTWAFSPEKIERYPDNFEAFMTWGQVYEDAEGNPAANSRVALRDISAWVLRKSTGNWQKLQHSTGVEGAAFLENFDANQATTADERVEPDGSVSIVAGNGTNYHFWPEGGRVDLDSTDIAGLAMTLDSRLVLDDAEGPDDRAEARYLVGVGADLWLDRFVDHNPPHTIQAVGLGRMRYVRSTWQTVTMTTLTADELTANPPPFVVPG